MEAAHLLAFNVTLLAAMASPGPALLFALRQTVRGGFWTGVATGAGLGLMAAAWTGAALLGLAALFALVPWLYLAMKLAGAAYLLWIAYHIWRDASKPVADSAQPGRRAFVGGLLVNLANPKSVLFAASVLVVIFPPDLSVAQKALIVGNHLVVELAVYTLFAGLLSTRRARDGYLRLKPIFDRIAAGVLGLLGLRLLMSR
ncbi:LysE family translocator [Lacimonas salitolerans]|uniref:LysE family translocator n=1 Tax=Lacimonas salitolerans TaxID=1323750 RepID=A0ABW4EGF3_9RHOB